MAEPDVAGVDWLGPISTIISTAQRRHMARPASGESWAASFEVVLKTLPANFDAPQVITRLTIAEAKGLQRYLFPV